MQEFCSISCLVFLEKIQRNAEQDDDKNDRGIGKFPDGNGYCCSAEQDENEQVFEMIEILQDYGSFLFCRDVIMTIYIKVGLCLLRCQSTGCRTEFIKDLVFRYCMEGSFGQVIL